jgi:hypothetical protein
VAAHGNHQAEGLDGHAAEDKAGPRACTRGGKEYQGCDGEKETGWHDQQSGKLHVFPLPKLFGRPAAWRAAHRTELSGPHGDLIVLAEGIERPYEF